MMVTRQDLIMTSQAKSFPLILTKKKKNLDFKTWSPLRKNGVLDQDRGNSMDGKRRNSIVY